MKDIYFPTGNFVNVCISEQADMPLELDIEDITGAAEYALRGIVDTFNGTWVEEGNDLDSIYINAHALKELADMVEHGGVDLSDANHDMMVKTVKNSDHADGVDHWTALEAVAGLLRRIIPAGMLDTSSFDIDGDDEAFAQVHGCTYVACQAIRELV